MNFQRMYIRVLYGYLFSNFLPLLSSGLCHFLCMLHVIIERMTGMASSSPLISNLGTSVILSGFVWPLIPFPVEFYKWCWIISECLSFPAKTLIFTKYQTCDHGWIFTFLSFFFKNFCSNYPFPVIKMKH